MLKKIIKRFRNRFNRSLINELLELKGRMTHIENTIQETSTRIRNNIKQLEQRNNELGFNQLGGRIDYRLTRLELLLHYANTTRYEKLGDAEKSIIRHLETEYMAGLPTKFPKLPPPSIQTTSKIPSCA